MAKQTFSTTANPIILIEVQGNLNLRGWDEQQINASCSNPDDLTMEPRGEEVFISCPDDLSLRVPAAAQVRILSLGGDANIKLLEGPLQAQSISGNLNLRAVAETRLEIVRGNLSAKDVSGDLALQEVSGNAVLRDIEGDLSGLVRGNLRLDDVDGDTSLKVNGNASLSLDPSPGNTYRIEADGSIFCRLPSDASLALNVPRANKILVRIPEAGLTSPVKPPFTLDLGDADADLILSAAGDVAINSLPSDWFFEDLEVGIGEDFEQMAENLGEQITQQVESHLDMLSQQLEMGLGNLSRIFGPSGIAPEKAEKMTQRAQEARERAHRKAQEKLQRAQEKMQRKLEAARRRAEMKARAAERAARDRPHRPHTPHKPPRPQRPPGFSWAGPPGAGPADEPVSDEERMLILHMLEQGKISPEEAEQLLAALEGKSG
jgi:hypothetical protein